MKKIKANKIKTYHYCCICHRPLSLEMHYDYNSGRAHWHCIMNKNQEARRAPSPLPNLSEQAGTLSHNGAQSPELGVCPDCKGSGRDMHQIPSPNIFNDINCTRCNGTGKQ